MSTLNIDFGKLWCRKHFEPYRTATPPIRVIAAGLMLDTLMADPTFFSMCDGNMDNIERNLYSVAPVCCYLSESQLQTIYLRTGRIGKYGPAS